LFCGEQRDGFRSEGVAGVSRCIALIGSLVLRRSLGRGGSGVHGWGKAANFQAGFSLLELVIVLGLVGVLATLALPSYQQYVRTATVREGAMSLLALALLQERLRITRGEYQPVTVLLTYRPLSDRLRHHYRLAAAVSKRPSEFVLSLNPTVTPGGYPLLTLDSRGRREPAQHWP
jgi:type IV pilus assembly protein PilE